MESEFLVGVVIVLTLWVFVILVAVTPWFGVSIIPYMVIFTFMGAVAILAIIWAYKSDSLEGLGWETLVILLLIMAAVLVGLFVLWYFIRKKLKTFNKKVDEMKVCEEIKERKESHYHEVGKQDDGRPTNYRLPPPSKYSPSGYQEGSQEGRMEGRLEIVRLSPPFNPAAEAFLSTSSPASFTQGKTEREFSNRTSASPPFLAFNPEGKSVGSETSSSFKREASLGTDFKAEGTCPVGGGLCKMNTGF